MKDLGYGLTPRSEKGPGEQIRKALDRKNFRTSKDW